MYKHWFGLSALLASMALLVWSIGETFAYPQGPNVSLGSNPIVSIDCNGGYTVPSNTDLIITDFIGVSSYPSLQVNGVHSLSLTDGTHNLTTGWKIPGGSAISCYSGGAYLTGYLTHP